MQRRGESGQPVKGRRTSKPKARKAPAAPLSGADVQEQIDRLVRERDEALEREAATANVLKVISGSMFDLNATLKTMLQSAGKLCQAENVQIFLRDGGFYRLAADNGFSPEYQRYVREHPITPGRGTLVARTALGVVPAQIPDRLADPEYTYHEGGNLGGYRTMLGVPLVRDGNCVGVIVLTRREVRPFTDKQIELVKTSLLRPSSPSRTRGCSTSCANRCSSRPPPPTCSRSSAARLLICKTVLRYAR